MFSDERMGNDFLAALAKMPKGSGLVFRHYAVARAERHALYEKARTIAKARRMVVMLAGSAQQARGWRADGVHGAGGAFSTAPVHNLRELIAAERAGVDLVFISPVFATRSHIGGRALGYSGFARLALRSKVPVIALGGMTAARARTLRGAYGWAGIDAWL